MTPVEALNQAQDIYKEMAGTAGSMTEVPTQAEKVKTIVEIARFIRTISPAGQGKGQFCEQCGTKLSQDSSHGESS